MKIRIHPETTDGKPIPGSGPILAADTPAAIVELMRLQSPFSAALSADDYCHDVLRHVEGDHHLPDDPDAASAEFLTRLALHGRIEFLPDELLPEIDEPPGHEEVAPCAGK